MLGGGEFRLRPGEWADDTAVTLCLRWLRVGRMSSTGEAFVVGNTIQRALEDFERHDHPFAGGR